MGIEGEDFIGNPNRIEYTDDEIDYDVIPEDRREAFEIARELIVNNHIVLNSDDDLDDEWFPDDEEFAMDEEFDMEDDWMNRGDDSDFFNADTVDGVFEDEMVDDDDGHNVEDYDDFFDEPSLSDNHSTHLTLDELASEASPKTSIESDNNSTTDGDVMELHRMDDDHYVADDDDFFNAASSGDDNSTPLNESTSEESPKPSIQSLNHSTPNDSNDSCSTKDQPPKV